MSRIPIYEPGTSYGSSYGSIDTEPLIYSPSPLFGRQSKSPAELRAFNELGLSNDIEEEHPDETERHAGDNDRSRGPSSHNHRNGNRSDAEKGGGDDMGGQLTISTQVKDSCRSCCTPQTFISKFPILKWIPQYRGGTLIADMVAGLTVGLTVIPQGLAYAQIAGLPAQYGLYSAFMGCFIYCLMGTSKDITLGPTAIMSLMTATFGADPNPEVAVTCAIVLTLVSGVVQFTMGILKLGILVSYISYPVINAFTSAAAITIAFGQIKNILGLTDIDREFLHMVYETFAKIPETKIWDMVMGLISLVAVILLKKLRQIKWANENDPNAEISIGIKIFRKVLWFCGTAANAIIVISAAGIVGIMRSQDINEITCINSTKAGMPPVELPKFSVTHDNGTFTASELLSKIGPGLGIVPLLGLVETMAIGKAFARANNYKIDPTQELLAIGTANIISSFFSSYPITGSFSRTAVNSQSGVRTPMGGLFTGGLVILALCVLTPLFVYIPKSALAAVIIAAVIQMVDYEIIRKLWRANKWDSLPWAITFITSLAIGIEYGILIGIGISLFMLLYPIARPKVKYTNYSGVVVVTPMQGINFPASEHLEIKAMERAQESEKPRSIIINLEHVTDLDYTAVQSFKSLHAECVRKGMKLLLTNAQPHIKLLIKNADVKDLTCHPVMRDALEDLNIQDGQMLGPEEAEPFMNQI